MFVWSVLIVSGLDSHCPKVSSRCWQYFPAAVLVSLGGTPTWRLNTELCKFVPNISTDIWRSVNLQTKLWRGVLIIYLLWLYNFLILFTDWFSNYFFNWMTVQCKNIGNTTFKHTLFKFPFHRTIETDCDYWLLGTYKTTSWKTYLRIYFARIPSFRGCN